MTIQKDLLADDPWSTTSTDSISKTTTTTAIENENENTHAGPSSDPLYKPIPLPKPFKPYSDRFHNSDNVSPYMAIEEATTSSMIHAACRLYEASEVTMNAFQKIIFRWTGMTPEQMESSALLYGSTETEPIEPKGQEGPEELLLYKAKLLMKIFAFMQPLVKLTGITAGLAIDTRRFAVSNGLFLPLSAFTSNAVVEKFAAFSLNSTMDSVDETNIEELSKALIGTSNCSPLWKLCYSPGKRSSYDSYFGIHIFSSDFFTVRFNADKAMQIVKQATPATANNRETESKTTEEKARHSVQELVRKDLVKRVDQVASKLLFAAEVASCVAKYRRPFTVRSGSVQRWWSRMWTKETDADAEYDDGTHDGTDDEILQGAIDACKQAVAAVNSAKFPGLAPRMKH